MSRSARTPSVFSAAVRIAAVVLYLAALAVPGRAEGGPFESGGSTPPTATVESPSGNVVVVPGGSVSFRGSGSDPDGTVESYRWTFDGVREDSTLEEPGDVIF